MYPVGTKCVITWATEWTTCQFGEVVTVGSETWENSSFRGRDGRRHNVSTAQDIVGRHGWVACLSRHRLDAPPRTCHVDGMEI